MMANSGTLALIAWLLPALSFLVLAIVFPLRRLGKPAAWFSILCAAAAFASAAMRCSSCRCAWSPRTESTCIVGWVRSVPRSRR